MRGPLPQISEDGLSTPRKSLLRRCIIQPRHQIVAACFLATFVAYVERVGFSIAYTQMAKEAGVDEGVKGTVLSAFFWGYAISQVPGGWAAQKWGGRIMLMFSFALWSTASILTPASAVHTAPIAAARVCVGIAQGFLIPSVHTVLSQWIPPHERARAVSLTTSGMYLGSAGAMLVLPGVAAAFGPAVLLRSVGMLGLAWLALWMVVGREVPHRESIIPMSAGESGGKARKGRPAATPWFLMLTNPAVWAIVVNNFTFHYSFYVVMNWLPTYFDKVLHANLASLGSVKTAPYLVMFATSNFGGWLGDHLISERKFSVAAARKTVNCCGFWGAAVALLLMVSAKGVPMGVAATTLALGFCGLSRGGFSVNHMDIAPKYAGVVMGISNTAGTLAGLVGVAVTGLLLERASRGADSLSLSGWWTAFSIAAIQCIFGSVVFLVFARGDRIFGESEHL